MKTIAGADAGFAHSLKNQANPAPSKASPRCPPSRNIVTPPVSIRDQPAAHINTNATGEDAAREKEGASQASHAVPTPTIAPRARRQTTVICMPREPRTMPTILAPWKRRATRVCTKDPARRCRAWPDVGVGGIIEALGVSSDAQEVDDMDTRSRRLITVIASLLAVALVTTACGASPGRGVGSQPASIVLALANGNHDHVALEPFAEAVATSTGGTVTVRFEDAVHVGDAAYESAIIDDVAAGTYDLAWVAPRPWHAKGVTTFDALMAPFLVDSYALQQAVLESDLERDMLAGLDGTGLVGLGILPGPLRRVAMAEGGFRAPDDLRGKRSGSEIRRSPR